MSIARPLAFAEAVPMPELAFSRRSALYGLGAAGLSAALAGCGVPAAYVPEEGREGPDRSERDRSVAFSNWPLYIDTDEEDEERRPTLEAFSEQTGIEVRYTEEINDNDEFFGKVSPALMNRQETGHDLIVVSDWMAARFVHLGWAQKLDRPAQPNVARHLDPQLRSPPSMRAGCTPSPGSRGSPASPTTARPSAGRSSRSRTCGNRTWRARSPSFRASTSPSPC